MLVYVKKISQAIEQKERGHFIIVLFLLLDLKKVTNIKKVT